MGLVWLMPVAMTGCGALTTALGPWALVLAVLAIGTIVTAMVWSTGGDR